MRFSPRCRGSERLLSLVYLPNRFRCQTSLQPPKRTAPPWGGEPKHLLKARSLIGLKSEAPSFGQFSVSRGQGRVGGADRDRTGDPLLAKQVLSQLSYSPVVRMVGLGRFELPTSPLSGVRSNQLSYRPGAHPKKDAPNSCLVRPSRKGFEDQVNMLTGYAGHDHRGIAKGQRRFDSGTLRHRQERDRRGTWQHPANSGPKACPRSRSVRTSAMTFSLRKEVIQPQVLLRLPCYDFTPIMNYTLGGCSLAVSPPTSSATHFRDVTGGVYKARERIHRGVLIRDY